MKRWRCPTRPLILIALLLFAGAVVNVGVAWGIAARAPGNWRLSEISHAARWSIRDVPASWPSTCLREIYMGFGYRHSHESAPAGAHAEVNLCLWAIGFPLPALTMEREYARSADGVYPQIRPSLPFLQAPDAALDRGWFHGTHGKVPVFPLVSGFALNTLFYAAILALPLSASPLRRRLRARRNKCAKCGYDLAGLAGADRGAAAPCPECGAAR